MDFRLLGPLEVTAAGRPVAVGSGKRRALLALLLVHANEALARERIVDELWGEQPSATAERAVMVYVSQLRKALGAGGSAGALATRGSAYVLEVASDEVDVRRFEEGLSQGVHALRGGDAAAAAVTLRDALAEWRGPPLADFTYWSFAQREIARLEELRLVALERRLEAELAVGRSADVVPELDALIAEHPLREGLRALEMRALYPSGRQADALEVYKQTRRTLVEQLGIEPALELQELEARILRHDPSLAPAPATVTRRAARPGRLAAGELRGRERELAELEAGLGDALAGRGRVFVLAGGPGLGKTRLADEIASRAKERGAHVLWSRGWDAGGAPPLWPWIQLLRSYARGNEEADSLRDLVARAQSSAALASDAARFALFDAVRDVFVAGAQKEPLVLVFDDLQAADESSLLLLSFVADTVAEARMLVVACARALEPQSGAAPDEAIRGLVRRGAATIALRPLSAGLDDGRDG